MGRPAQATMLRKHEVTIRQQATLVESCKAGNRKAQYQIYQDYSKAMYNVCFRILKDSHDAEDALQESFLSAFKNIDKYKINEVKHEKKACTKY